ncbi:MAG: GIY-YIG nuclease family protein [Candidatus Dependentiae bacterium]|nr:GIY-YIG nuclease family protein [Candidatus Dependentiae bacterium]
MFYVYVLRSLAFPEQIYIGYTSDLRNRLLVHNDSRVPHTSKYIPWEFISFFAFKEKMKAINFEIYLKSGSGKEFLKKRLI